MDTGNTIIDPKVTKGTKVTKSTKVTKGTEGKKDKKDAEDAEDAKNFGENRSIYFLIENPLLLAQWKISAVKVDNFSRKLFFTVRHTHRIEVYGRTSDSCDVTVTYGIYKKKNSSVAKDIDPKDIKTTIENLILEMGAEFEKKFKK